MRVAIVGVPVDLGASRRGTDMGPSAIRYARLRDELAALGHDVVDLGNVEVPVPESRPAGDAQLKYLREIEAVCVELAAKVAKVLRDGRLPVVLGGDHSLSIGSVAGLAQAVADAGLLWLDAHGDFNTAETSPSGNIHGMPLAVITGRGAAPLVAVGGAGVKIPADRAVLVGVRDLDRGERRALLDAGVRVFTMKEIDQIGMSAVMEQAIDLAGGGGRRRIHLSLDMDVLDPGNAPGVGTPVPGGLTYREAQLAMELLADSGALCSLELVEVNPILDHGNQTARLAVELAASALGKRIL